MSFGGTSWGRLGRRFVAAAHGRASLGAVLAAALACALAPAAALAATAAPADGGLSPRLATLDSSGLRGADPSEQAEALSLPDDGPGSLLRDGRRLLAYVRFESGAAAGVQALREAGAEVVSASARYQTVTVAAPPAVLARLAGIDGVAGVTEALAPIVRATCAGSVRSEGDAQLEAARAREDFAVDGNGVTVGILSDSFDRDATAATHAATDIGSGDLPGPGSPCGSTPVGVLGDSEAEGSDEGRAMAQIVHDLAPGAAIDFATAFNGEIGFAENVRRLTQAGAKVIADDVTYLEEPFFQDGPVANAVGEAVGSGVSYFAAAGNDNLIVAGHNVGSWEAAEFRDTACPSQLEAKAEAEHCMNFRPGAGAPDPSFGITVGGEATLTLDLQWAEPWNGVKSDFDAYLLNGLGEPITEEDGMGNPVLVGSYGNNIASQRPAEVLQWENPSKSPAEVSVAINRCFGTCNKDASSTGAPRLKFALLENGAVRPSSAQLAISEAGDTFGPTVFGHAGSTNAIAVGAVRYNETGNKPEAYSSRGPVKHFFGPVSGAGPAAAIAAQEISKPDLVATDCGATTFFAQQDAAGTWRFCGTSAAAPHAAAVAALIRQANPNASAAQVRAALTSTARAVPGFGLNDVGAGIVNAGAAVAALSLAPTVTITKGPEPFSRNRRPAIEFKANRPGVFSCAIDGGPAQVCSSPYTVPVALSDGTHGIAVSMVDRAGRAGSSSVASFRIDTKAPRTRIAKHPRKVVRTHRRSVRLGFRFRANEPEVIFVCKIDRGLLRFCGPNFSRRFAAGKHVLTVRARDAAGNVQRKASVFHFKVKRVG